jgi:hypothetical protein
MILDKEIFVKITKQNIEHFSQFEEFVDIKLKDIIEVEPSIHLQKNSNLKFNVKCDLCDTERYIKFQAYSKNINSSKKYPIYTCDKCSHIKLKETNKIKYGCEYYSQHPDRNDKVKKTSLDKYGTEHFSKSKEFTDKVHKTNLEKFGYINPFMDKERIKRIFKEKYGVNHPSELLDEEGEYKFYRKSWIPKSKKSEWNNYKAEVRRKSKQNIKFLEWDGTDFYDNEYIKDNFIYSHYHNNYPTIYHKISIFDGFNNGINSDEISDINNLCWTKRIINISKNSKSHYDRL